MKVSYLEGLFEIVESLLALLEILSGLSFVVVAFSDVEVIMGSGEIDSSAMDAELVSEEYCVTSEEDDSGALAVIVNPFLVRVRVSLVFFSVFVQLYNHH